MRILTIADQVEPLLYDRFDRQQFEGIDLILSCGDLPPEYLSFLLGKLNVPLYFIRLKLSQLDENTTYIVCCDTGRRSSAGAFILNERGYKARVLKGGLNTSDLELTTEA